MNTLTHSSVFLITPNAYGNQNSLLLIANGLSSSSFPLIPKSWTTEKFSVPRSKSVILCAKKKNDEKEDRHSFIAKPDEAIGPFPEAVLLKEVTLPSFNKKPLFLILLFLNYRNLSYLVF